jgi:hypothetical protein
MNADRYVRRLKAESQQLHKVSQVVRDPYNRMSLPDGLVRQSRESTQSDFGEPRQSCRYTRVCEHEKTSYGVALDLRVRSHYDKVVLYLKPGRFLV